MLKQELSLLLKSESFISRIMRDFAFIEWKTNYIISSHFAVPDKIDELKDIILSDIGISRKLSYLQVIKFNRKTDVTKLVKNIRKLCVLRNALAHNHYIGEKRLSDFFNDNELREILSEFPKNYNPFFELIDTDLNKLTYIQFVKSYTPKQLA